MVLDDGERADGLLEQVRATSLDDGERQQLSDALANATELALVRRSEATDQQ